MDNFVGTIIIFDGTKALPYGMVDSFLTNLVMQCCSGSSKLCWYDVKEAIQNFLEPQAF